MSYAAHSPVDGRHARRLTRWSAPLLTLLLGGCVATGGGERPSLSLESLRTLGSSSASSGGGGQSVLAAVAPALGVAAPGPAGSPNLIELLKQSVETIDESKEIEIGRQLSAILLGSKPLHPNTALQRYVNNLGRWISLQSARPNLPWTFMVLDDPGFNAFAAPGGYVFVTKGLIDRAVGEAELGGVLAHEIVHVVEKHHLKALAASARTGLLTQVAASQLRSDVGGLVGAQLLNLGRNLFSKGLDRGDEYEADRKGVALAARAGLDPFGLPSLLHTLSTARADNPLFSLALSTHPPTNSRLQQLESAMGTRLNALANKPAVGIAQRVPGATTAPAQAVRATSQPTRPATTPATKPATKPAAKPVAKPATTTTR